MNGMGDIRFDEHALLRALGPQVDSLATGALHRAALALRAGGVGYYPASNFVHVDTGPVRRWG